MAHQPDNLATRQKCQVWRGVEGVGTNREECFQKEGAELGSQAGREGDSRNMNAPSGRPRHPSAPGQGPYAQGPCGHRVLVRQTWMLDAEARPLLHLSGSGHPIQPL